MKKFFYVLITLFQVSTGLAMLPAKQEISADDKTELMRTVLRNQLSERSMTDFLSSIDIQDQIGRTALHWAAAMGNKIFMVMLKTAGANTTIRDSQNKTADDIYEETTKMSDRCSDYSCEENVQSEQTSTELSTSEIGNERPAISVIYHPNSVNTLNGEAQKVFHFGYYADLTR